MGQSCSTPRPYLAPSCRNQAPRWAVAEPETTNAEDSCFSTMTTSGWQRRELRRALPPAVRQRNIKVLNHLGIAGMIASRQTRRGPKERDDLEQEARVGLIRGWERFDPRRGLKLSTFLSTATNGQVLHFRRDRAVTIRVPWLFKLPSDSLSFAPYPLPGMDLVCRSLLICQCWYEPLYQADTRSARIGASGLNEYSLVFQ
ncbi:sigma factor [Parasynechococcus marenigrum]